MDKYKSNRQTVLLFKFFLTISVIFILSAGCAKKNYNADQPHSLTQDTHTGYSDIVGENKNSDIENVYPEYDNAIETINDQNEEIPVYINSEGNTLDTRILTPKGYTRIQSSPDELAGFIRSLPLKEDGSKVLKYDGKPINNQDNHVAVFDIDIGKKDLQQCADSVMRIYGEYYWSLGEYDKIAFHLTNGFLMEYTKWREGNRIKVDGNDVCWIKSASYDDSYECFIKYMETVFTYAGTLSLTQESRPVSLEELLPGDLLLEGGSPGHCVMIVDMAVDKSGNRCYLLAQGYMPAQDFHVLKNPLHPEDPWYYENEMAFPIKTPSWTFKEGSLRRWADFELKQGNGRPVSSDCKGSVTLLARNP